jgi:hypothetical protein
MRFELRKASRMSPGVESSHSFVGIANYLACGRASVADIASELIWTGAARMVQLGELQAASPTADPSSKIRHQCADTCNLTAADTAPQSELSC